MIYEEKPKTVEAFQFTQVVDEKIAVFNVSHAPKWLEQAFTSGRLFTSYGNLHLFDERCQNCISVINPGGWALNSYDHGLQLMSNDEFERRYKKVT